MKRVWLFLLALALNAFALPAHAVPVLLLDRIGPPIVAVGDTAVFELRIAGLGDVLGAFSADILFDPAVLSFAPAPDLSLQFGSRLGDPLLETIGLAQVFSAGVLHVDQVSLLDAASLDALQRDPSGALLSSFVLAHLSFVGLAPGASLVDFDGSTVVLSDSAGNAVEPPLLAGSAVFVSQPATGWLVGLGLLCLLASRQATSASERRAARRVSA